MPLTLTPLAAPISPQPSTANLRGDARAWRFPEFFSLTTEQIAQLPLQIGNRTRTTGECFSITGDGADQTLIIAGDISWLDWLGGGLAGGSISVRGSVGDFCGAEMSAGQISILGDAGHGAGCQMSGGTLVIEGNTGNNTAGCFAGSLRGQRGGTVLIGGSVGNHAGQYQRRGLLVIGGNAAAEAGLFQRAGTIIIGGTAGPRMGQGMRRGTIGILAKDLPKGELKDLPAVQPFTKLPFPDCLTPGRFVPGYQGQPVVFNLLARHLRNFIVRNDLLGQNGAFSLGTKLTRICEELQGKLRLFHGDLLAAGKGEVWIAAV
ncbi:MAG: formylmethanofuran dehydrogenase subunit C [Pirellulales bacterium]|nr:formylmethanofuran dehydrogenase subunit C [Pirellulales bacterium]